MIPENLFLKKYAILFAKAMLSLGALLGAQLIAEPYVPRPVLRTILLPLVVVVTVYFLWGIWRLLRTHIKSDEMDERIWTRGMFYAHSASIVLAGLYGVLELTAGLPRLSGGTVSMALVVIGFVSVVLVQRRYA
ncbi:MAG TPA: hypothetical protein VGC13_02625 [Longimicrobium sp.]|jgi:hypothetical protein|uniref:hypothetical protein n=1 Tax=Longimicrobium sp. TaxID=2029185 RepID=UPI002EDB90A3